MMMMMDDAAYLDDMADSSTMDSCEKKLEILIDIQHTIFWSNKPARDEEKKVSIRR